MAPLIELRNLVVEIPTPHGWIRPVNEISLRIEPGESLGLVGESGSGKSMLALAVMGLLPPGAKVRGEAWFAQSSGDGTQRVNFLTLSERERVATRGRDVAMIFQEPMTALNPVMRIGAQVAEAIRTHHSELNREEVKSQLLAALDRAAVPEPELRARQYPHQLSGGLRQRVMIAMALAGGITSTGKTNSHTAPRLLIADEPTTALDVTVQKQILELLARLRRDLGLTLLFITHDLGVVAQVADRIAVTYAGRIVEDGSVREVLDCPRHPYTAGLLRASPTMVRQKLQPIPGTVPPLTALPRGCAFEPRCPSRIPECTRAVPELHMAAPLHAARCILVESFYNQGGRSMTPKESHLDTVRERFTATADTFAEGVRKERKDQAERLAECATEGLPNLQQALVIDVACGPGTYTRPLAARVRRAIGVDLTPAMVEKARAESARESITNVQFICADGNELPFEDATVDIVACGYAVHHMLEPVRSIQEMVRVLRPGGRVAIMDCIVPPGGDAAVLDAIEIARDPSHTSTPTLDQFRGYFREAGLHIIFEELKDRWHDFDGWMRNAGSYPGDIRYVEVLRMLENPAPGPISGLGPRRSAAGLEVLHPYLLLVGEKPE